MAELGQLRLIDEDRLIVEDDAGAHLAEIEGTTIFALADDYGKIIGYATTWLQFVDDSDRGYIDGTCEEIPDYPELGAGDA